MHIYLVTLFPTALGSYFQSSILAKGITEGFFSIHYANPADYSTKNTRRADDRPYGGFPGTILAPEPTARAIEACQNISSTEITWFAPDPRGKHVTQGTFSHLSKFDNIGFVCGHYEGIDERLFEAFQITKLSLGNFVITSGELASAVMIDATIRLLPGLLNPESLIEESFSEQINYKKEYPQYTRPEVWRNISVPPVLVSGDHSAIAKWKHNILTD